MPIIPLTPSDNLYHISQQTALRLQSPFTLQEKTQAKIQIERFYQKTQQLQLNYQLISQQANHPFFEQLSQQAQLYAQLTNPIQLQLDTNGTPTRVLNQPFIDQKWQTFCQQQIREKDLPQAQKDALIPGLRSHFENLLPYLYRTPLLALLLAPLYNRPWHRGTPLLLYSQSWPSKLTHSFSRGYHLYACLQEQTPHTLIFSTFVEPAYDAFYQQRLRAGFKQTYQQDLPPGLGHHLAWQSRYEFMADSGQLVSLESSLRERLGDSFFELDYQLGLLPPEEVGPVVSAEPPVEPARPSDSSIAPAIPSRPNRPNRWTPNW